MTNSQRVKPPGLTVFYTWWQIPETSSPLNVYRVRHYKYAYTDHTVEGENYKLVFQLLLFYEYICLSSARRVCIRKQNVLRQSIYYAKSFRSNTMRTPKPTIVVCGYHYEQRLAPRKDAGIDCFDCFTMRTTYVVVSTLTSKQYLTNIRTYLTLLPYPSSSSSMSGFEMFVFEKL